MNAFYSGHDFKWTQKFVNALPKRKGLDYSKAICIAQLLQHKYILVKKREITLDHKNMELFGITPKNLKKYLPIFVKANLIKWTQKKGAAPRINLVFLPINYVLNNKEIKKNKKIKGTSTTVGEVTSTTVGEVTSTTVGEVEKSHIGRKGDKEYSNGMEERKDRKIGKEDREVGW